MDTSAENQRVYWHSRRGMLELDLVLMPFAQFRYPGLAPEEQLTYRRLLEAEDTDIFDWLMHRAAAPDPSLDAIVENILAYGRARVANTP